MGFVSAEIELANPRNPQLKPLMVQKTVDTSAMTICFPKHITIQLGLQEIEKREVTTADERSHVVPYVGPLQIHF